MKFAFYSQTPVGFSRSTEYTHQPLKVLIKIWDHNIKTAKGRKDSKEKTFIM
jgi:hypothetical protein